MLRQSFKNQSVRNAGWRCFALLVLATTASTLAIYSSPSQLAQKKPIPAQPVSAVQFHYLMKENAAADAAARQDAFPARSFERHSRRLQVMTSKNTTPYQRLA